MLNEQEDNECIQCAGTGEGRIGDTSCLSCRGTGRGYKPETEDGDPGFIQMAFSRALSRTSSPVV